MVELHLHYKTKCRLAIADPPTFFNGGTENMIKHNFNPIYRTNELSHCKNVGTSCSRTSCYRHLHKCAFMALSMSKDNNFNI